MSDYPPCMTPLGDDRYQCSKHGWVITAKVLPIHCNLCDGKAPAVADHPTRPPGRKYLGDRVHDALSAVGVTEERVSKWLGRPCGCARRRERMNQLHQWTERKLRGLFSSPEEAAEDLEDMMK